MTRRAFAQAYHRVRVWIRRHGAWPADPSGRCGPAIGWRSSACTSARSRRWMGGGDG
jgi:hypothetical protein